MLPNPVKVLTNSRVVTCVCCNLGCRVLVVPCLWSCRDRKRSIPYGGKKSLLVALTAIHVSLFTTLLSLRDALLEDQKQEAAAEHELPPWGNGPRDSEGCTSFPAEGHRQALETRPCPSEKRSSHDGCGYGIRLPAKGGHRLTRP